MTQMRLNKFIAHATGLSRRAADNAIAAGQVAVNGAPATLGTTIDADHDQIKLNQKLLALPQRRTLIMLNKPVGYVSSRRAQARNAKTLYELLPPKLRQLKTVGRLDQDSSGLILLTDDGDLAQQLTHPQYAKTKIYLVTLDRPLTPLQQQMTSDFGVDLPDGKSQLDLEKLDDTRTRWRVTMHEGRNRQIRRTFAALGLTVKKLHRTDFGPYSLGELPRGEWQQLE
jgi:pseudouridine synthase